MDGHTAKLILVATDVLELTTLKGHAELPL